MTTRSRLPMVGLVVAIASLSYACAAVLGFERLSSDEVVEGGVPDAADDAGPAGDGGSDAADPSCSEIGVGARPPKTDEDAGTPIAFAANVLDLGIAVGFAAGYNLDRTCSATQSQGSCTSSVNDQTFATFGADKVNGVDNSAYALMQALGDVSSAFEAAEINSRLRAGEFGITFRLSRWNGTPSDDSVRLDLFPAIRGSGGVLGDGGLAPPAFASTDTWVRDARFELVAGNDTSKINTSDAWVVNDTVTAFFTEASLPITVPNDPRRFELKLTDAWITVTLSRANGKLSGRGILSGRMKTADFLDEVRGIYVADSGLIVDKYVCEVPELFSAVKGMVCPARDIRSRGADDRMNKACDAVSVGAAFEVYAIDTEGPFDEVPPPPPTRCSETSPVAKGDDCP